MVSLLIRICNMLKDYRKSIGRRLDINVQIRFDKAKDFELLLLFPVSLPDTQLRDRLDE